MKKNGWQRGICKTKSRTRHYSVPVDVLRVNVGTGKHEREGNLVKLTGTVGGVQDTPSLNKRAGKAG